MRASWWWIDRWQKSTAYKDMTLAEQGAYRNLLDELWLRGGVLPDDERILARLSGGQMEWPAVRAAVMRHFQKTDGGWRNVTHDEVASESARRAEKQRRYRNAHGNGSGNGSGNAAGNGGRNVTASPSPSPSPDMSPDPDQEKEASPRARKRAMSNFIPEVLRDFPAFDYPEIAMAIEGYFSGRVERRQKPQTARGLRMALKGLGGLKVAEAVAVIEKATAGGWLGWPIEAARQTANGAPVRRESPQLPDSREYFDRLKPEWVKERERQARA